MSAPARKADHTIPQRADIETTYTWNLADLYPTESDWETDFQKAESLIADAGSFAGHLAGSAEMLYRCLETRSSLSLVCANLYQYAKLHQDLDNRVSKYQALSSRAAMLSSRAAAAYAFVEPELLAIDEQTLLAMGRQFPRDDIYDFYLAELIRSRTHIRSSEVEELMAQSAMVARGPETIYTMLDDADLTYPAVRDESGVEVPLTKMRYAKFMESSDRRVRREANDAFMQSYRAHINTTAAALAGAVNGDIFYARARRYPDCLHAALDGGNIPTSVYHSLLDTTEAGLTGLHDWITLRKHILAVEPFYPYDAFCPLYPEEDDVVAYPEAVATVLAAVAPLGTAYVERMRHGFDSRWVDVYETQGKGSGAYSWPNYTSHPYVLMNYNGTIANMFTLAHEMGHALHSDLSNAAQPYAKAQYSIFVAEVASTLNEGLLLQHLLSRATNARQKRSLLIRQIDSAFKIFFHQVMYARFELTIHELVERGEALSPEGMNGQWGELMKQYYGPALTLDEYAPYRWSRIPHFYRAFYVYQYATSFAASQAILDRFMAGEAGIIEKYLALLSAGGSDYPINLLRRCGVDMAKPEPVEATLRLFARQVEEVRRLTKTR